MSNEATGFEIAIIGMAGRFPGSRNINEFWQNLCDGKNLLTSFTKEELIDAGIPEELVEDPNYVRTRGIIEDVDKFDADLFGFFPKEVEMLDPQQRLFLECSWEAMEDAGYCPDDYNGLVGVFGGIGMNTYGLQFLTSKEDLISSAEGYQLSIGNDKDFVTTRVSYKLNLNGPSIDVQSACSTSLVASHVACMNLYNYQCDLAIAGGATISLPQKAGYMYQEGMILSPDGLCRPFDEKAKGTVGSNGVGIVVLKRLDDAVRDKDTIYAVIKGSAYNNDGSVKVGYTAPGVAGQANVINSAYAMANVPMSGVGYIEAHGTGTTLGDPIEIDALTQAFRNDTQENNYCAIGSVKSNLGHLDTAAGVTGLIKAALSIYHGKIPPSINFEKSNPQIQFEKTPFYVNDKLSDWNKNFEIKRAGVSSFGIGGTNAHLVLEEGPSQKEEIIDNKYHLFPFSSKSVNSLENLMSNYTKFLGNNPSVDNSDIAFTMQFGRKHFEHRSSIVANNINSLKEKIDRILKNGLSDVNEAVNDNPEIVFMFSGQGAQYINMGKELYTENSIFSKHLDDCFNLLKNEHGLDLKNILFCEENENNNVSEKLKQTEYTQPALFSIEYSIASTLMEYGVNPDLMVGHSIGEYVAACISGVIELDSAINIVVKRGKLMQDLDPGFMLSINMSERDLIKVLPENLDLAVVNSTELCVVSGPKMEIESFNNELKSKNIISSVLHTSHAFHSRMMEPISDEFREIVESCKLNNPKIPYMSNVTGNIITDYECTDPNYYVNHLRHTVRFSENISYMVNKGHKIFVEIGPGNTLSTLLKNQFASKKLHTLSTLRHPKQAINDNEFLLEQIGKLWQYGIDIKWMAFHERQRARVHLPTYVFDKKSYWINSNGKAQKSIYSTSSIDDKIYESSWKRFKNIEVIDENKKLWLIFDDAEKSISNFIKSRRPEDEVITVLVGDSYVNKENSQFYINIKLEDDYQKLFKELDELKKLPDRIIHSWSLLTEECDVIANAKYGYFSLIHISNAISSSTEEVNILMDVLTSNIFDVIGNEKLIPERSTILGATKVIHQEFENLQCRTIEFKSNEKNEIEKNSEVLFRQLLSSQMEIGIALRNNVRWIQRFDKISLNKNAEEKLVKENSLIVITGGLGRIGLTFAHHLGAQYNAKLVLLDHSELPERNEWEKVLSSTNKDKTYYRISNILQLEQSDIEYELYNLNVANPIEFEQKLTEIEKKHGNINGIIHAAGSLGDSMVKTVDQVNSENFQEQINTKILATKNIDSLNDKFNFDFVILQSSLSAILGGLGFSNYSAGNCFLDAFVSMKNQIDEGKTKWIGINWDGWIFDENTSTNNSAITPKFGVKYFDKIISQNDLDEIVISVENLDNRIDKWIINKHKNKIENDEIENKSFHERPDITSEYLEAKSEVELKVLEEWQKLLGIEKIGVNDNFFELGGNSLIGTQLVSRMRKIFNTEIPLIEVFENATIKGITNIVEKNNGHSSISNEMGDLFKLINNMSDEDASELLNNRKQMDN